MIGVLIIIAVWLFFSYKVFLQLLNRPKLSIKNPTFNYIFGVPGGGKSSMLAYLYHQAHKMGLKVYSNIDLSPYPYQKITVDDIGKKRIQDGILLFDESSIDFNNRAYKTMSKDAIKWFKKHRHYNCSVYIFSQSYEDTDITLRRLCQRYYYIRKSRFFFISHTIIVRRIRKIVEVDKLTRQIIDGYDFVPLSKWCFNQKKVRKYFDSFERDLNLSDFEDYNSFQSSQFSEPGVSIEPGEPKKVVGEF